MLVNLNVLLPGLSETMGRKQMQFEFPGHTVLDLIEHLIACYGPRVSEALYDRGGELDPTIQVLLNGEQWLAHDRLDTALGDGDEVMFLLLAGGG